MDINIKPQGDRVLIELAGSVDELGAEELKRRFLELDVPQLKEVVFDFGAVTFIGSAGIGKLLLFYKSLAGQGGKVTIMNMNKDIHTMFKVVKLDKIFNLSGPS